ncbi:MAG: DUF1275 domain-containing protein [Solobacterium sp.]|nr:DUF1275 domain-containing protein [Solobacterium sp.]
MQKSDRFLLSALLAFSGGFQDAYTYIARGKVFANAQTGNLVLLSVNLMEGEYATALHYIWPLLAFACGVFAAEQIGSRRHRDARLHWRQKVLLAEIILLAGAAFVPERYNTLANMLVSFSCAMQVEAFRHAEGNSYASTMIIGNLRSGVSNLSVWLREKDSAHRKAALFFFSIIVIFGIGGGIGGIMSLRIGMKAVLVCPLILLLGCLYMK